MINYNTRLKTVMLSYIIGPTGQFHQRSLLILLISSSVCEIRSSMTTTGKFQLHFTVTCEHNVNVGLRDQNNALRTLL
jgi:hypothetical protein